MEAAQVQLQKAETEPCTPQTLEPQEHLEMQSRMDQVIQSLPTFRDIPLPGLLQSASIEVLLRHKRIALRGERESRGVSRPSGSKPGREQALDFQRTTPFGDQLQPPGEAELRSEEPRTHWQVHRDLYFKTSNPTCQRLERQWRFA
ncbi:unnamed protein product [Pleuronectes platessa]|uniref:Uncharacterized protein n=1 Tax=Pleuronectes platessa TaxID=8262 RepID=A0A9N7TKS7_PLEPL|nr:unnamed protein product [Pleuronectes platessa]